MQDKETDGSKLVEIVARAICRVMGRREVWWENWTSESYDVLTAIKEAGYAVVPREPTAEQERVGGELRLMCRRDCSLGVPRAAETYRAMITAGEE